MAPTVWTTSAWTCRNAHPALTKNSANLSGIGRRGTLTSTTPATRSRSPGSTSVATRTNARRSPVCRISSAQARSIPPWSWTPWATSATVGRGEEGTGDQARVRGGRVRRPGAGVALACLAAGISGAVGLAVAWGPTLRAALVAGLVIAMASLALRRPTHLLYMLVVWLVVLGL